MKPSPKPFTHYKRRRTIKIMKTNLLRAGEVDHRAALECVHHRMMLRARHRARYGRWWFEQAQEFANQPLSTKPNLCLER